MSMKLYVGNLSFQTSSEDLQQLFAQAGTVESASVVEDRENCEPDGSMARRPLGAVHGNLQRFLLSAGTPR